MILFASNGGIYSNWVIAFNPTTNLWKTVSWTGGSSNLCDPDLPNMPGNRHVDMQSTIDTKRKVLWLFSGVNQNCGQQNVSISGASVTNLNTSGTLWTFPLGGQINGQTVNLFNLASSTNIGTAVVASVTDANHLTLTTSVRTLSKIQLNVQTGSESSPRQDLYYLVLNSDPATDTWHKVPFNTFPAGQGTASALGYDSDHDVLILHGAYGATQATFRFCSTLNAATGVMSGSLSPVQIAGGCTVADDWTTDLIGAAGGALPDGWSPLNYDPITHRMLHFGFSGCTGSGCTTSHTYAYNVPAKTWTDVCTGGCVNPPPYAGGDPPTAAVAYSTYNHHLYFHETVGSGAPKDWEYDPVVNTWTAMTSTGVIPAGNASWGVVLLAYDQKRNSLFSYDTNNRGTIDIGEGVLPVGSLNVRDGSCNLTGPTLTVREALFVGDQTGSTLVNGNARGGGGLDRIGDVLKKGIPTADSAGITSISSLGLGGMVSNGQFRIIETWPSGNAKFIEIGTSISALGAGGKQSIVLNNAGTGNFGGSNLATDSHDCTGASNANLIAVNTGVACFEIREANFNVIDEATVGSLR
jgi:hypothetical protein